MTQQQKKTRLNIETLTRLFALFATIFFLYSIYTQIGRLEGFTFQWAFLIPLVATVVIFMLVAVIGALIWYVLLLGMHEKHKFSTTTPVFLISQFAKYIPGNIGHLIGRVALAKTKDIPTAKVFRSLLMEILLLVMSSAILAAITAVYGNVAELPANSATPKTLMFVAIGLVLGTIAIFALLPTQPMRRFLKIEDNFNRSMIPKPRYLIIGFILNILNFVLVGFACDFIAHKIFSAPRSDIFLVSGIFCMSFVAGFMTPGAPAGIGVRESLLILLLGPIYGPTAAVGVATVTRLSQMIADGLVALLAGVVPKITKNNVRTTGE